MTAAPSPTTEAPAALTLPAVAAALGCSYRHARRLVADGKLDAFNIAASDKRPSWRVTAEALDALRNERAAR